MRSLIEVVLKLNEVLILATLQGSLDYALNMQNIEAFIEILSQHCSCSLTTDLVTRVLKFIILQKLIKFWMDYEDMVWKIRIGDVWSHDTYVHETNPLIWTLNTKFLFEFLALLTLKFEYIGKMVYK